MAPVLDFYGGDIRVALAAIAPSPVVRGSIYVVRFSSGIVKVGRTQNPFERMTAHVAEAARHGHIVTHAWVSQPHVGFAASEKALKDWCGAKGKKVAGTEYFGAVKIQAAIEFAAQLVDDAVTAEQIAAARPAEPEPAPYSEPVIPRLRTLDEAAEESGLPVTWLHDACHARRIAHTKCGRTRLLTPDQIVRASEVFEALAAA